MGNTGPNKMRSIMQPEISCTDDLICQNIDSRRSIPGQDPVLVCPEAKCMEGRCICGNNCSRDPYTGMCCKSIEERIIQTPMGEEKTTFCIEGPDKVLPNSENKLVGSMISNKVSLL